MCSLLDLEIVNQLHINPAKWQFLLSIFAYILQLILSNGLKICIACWYCNRNTLSSAQQRNYYSLFTVSLHRLNCAKVINRYQISQHSLFVVVVGLHNNVDNSDFSVNIWVMGKDNKELKWQMVWKTFEHCCWTNWKSVF